MLDEKCVAEIGLSIDKITNYYPRILSNQYHRVIIDDEPMCKETVEKAIRILNKGEVNPLEVYIDRFFYHFNKSDEIKNRKDLLEFAKELRKQI